MFCLIALEIYRFYIKITVKLYAYIHLCITYTCIHNYIYIDRGLPLITYAPRGGGGVNTNAYKCVQGGRGGLNMTKNTHLVRRFIKNATISKTFKERSHSVYISVAVKALPFRGLLFQMLGLYLR